MEVDSDYSDFENSPSPAPVKAKKAPAKKAPTAGALAPSTAHNVAAGKAIEEIYQKKSQLEHILLRPDTYIGSTEKQPQALWVHDGTRMVLKNVSIAPGLYKIFDEILVNAADNKVRDASMDTIKVHVDAATNSIQVWNNGSGIPVEIHKEEKVYVPELIFGHLLTSSNYDDNEKKITGGRNGYGAKLTNIFSTEFILETCDGSRQKKYRQVFRSNMTQKEDPKITTCKPTDNYTCVTFKPDLAKFGMEELEEDTLALMRKRVYDLAGILGKTCKVFLNGQRLGIKSFAEYVDLYLGPKESGPARIYERINDRWEVCISPTDGQFNQVSFVNAICTTKGGTHVNQLVDQLTKPLVEKLNKKNKAANVRPFMVKNHLWVFLNCQIENPAFDSQTKETLTLRASSFGSKCELSNSFVDKVAKSGLTDSILQFASFKSQKELKKSDGTKRQRILGIPKLDDANDAGGRNSSACTLILTEGDSAKTLAISGLGVVGRDQYGVFPLRGKLLNVRDASATQISGNVEIQALKQILGLQHGKVYENAQSLRYGHLMMMTDQDHDGSHIKGLIMNFLHSFYPSLLKVPGFLLEFITPIIKASKGKQRKVFYTMPEYESWKESLGGSTAGWSVKYYKGLGTSTREEAREYFAAIDHHRKRFVWTGDADGQSIEMAFSKKKVEDRKDWLRAFEPGTFLDNSASNITYSDFIHKELILFSRADLERSIPSMVDGLKPGQRKILFACFKRNLRKDIKVAQLAGYVSEHAAYHHGEQSLATTIIGLAQDFVGSNNINLLVPSGQFGTRLQGGKDAASARYIFTRMAPLTRHLFNEADDRLLTYLNEEGQSIEPEWYIPILPMVLVNGAEGIGTGWSTSIPNFNPHDIVNNIKRLMAGDQQERMSPWYRGFRGRIEEVTTRTAGKSYACHGIMEQVSDSMVEIHELPVRKWTQDYKEFLEGLVKPESKDETPVLMEYKEHHTDVTVHFVLDVIPDKMAELQAAGIETKLKLVSKFSTSNMMLFDAGGHIKHYATAEDVVAEFYTLRLDMYERRRLALLQAAEAELLRLSNKVRFILAVISGELVVNNRRKAVIEEDLQASGYDRMSMRPMKIGRSGGAAATEAGDEEDGEGDAAGAGLSYDYLLSMPIWSLTLEKVQALQSSADEQAVRVAQLAATSAQAMWTEDLDAFLAAFESWEADEEAAAQQLVKQQKGARGKTGKGKAGKPTAAAKAGKKKKNAWSGSDEDEDDWMSEDNDDDLMDEDQDFVKPKAKATATAKPPLATRPVAPAAAAAAVSKPGPSGVFKPAGSASSGAAKPASSGAGSKPITSTVAAAKASSGVRPAAGASKATVGPVASTSTSSAAAAPSEPLSLQARLAGRFQKLSMGSGAASGSVPKAATAQPAAVDDDAMVHDGAMALEATAESPAPVLLKNRAPAAQKAAAEAARPAAPAAKRKPAAAKAEPSKPAAASKPTKAPAAKPAARKKRVVSDSEDESEDASEIEIMDDSDDSGAKATFQMEAPSPAVAPKGKKSKVGVPTPLAMKMTSKTAGSRAVPAAKPIAATAVTALPAAAAAAAVSVSGADVQRPQRARRAAQQVSYIELEGSEEEAGAKDDSGSDFHVRESD